MYRAAVKEEKTVSNTVTQHKTQPQYMTVQEGVDFLRISRSTMWRLIRTGKLKRFRPAGTSKTLLIYADVAALVREV